MNATEFFTSSLEDALAQAERTLRAYGVGDWKATLIVRSPTDAARFIVTTSDDLPAVAALLAKHAKQAGAAGDAT